jgi:hypothetical protein
MASEKLLQAMRLVEEASRAYEEGDNFGVVIRAYRIVETLSQFLLYLTGHYVEANDLPNYLVLVKGWQKTEAFARKLVNLYRKLYFAYKVEESSLIARSHRVPNRSS